MKIQTLLFSVIFISFQVQGMENEKIEIHTENYTNAIQKLSELSQIFMEKLDVNGRDYSELVIQKTNKAGATKYHIDQYIECYFHESLKNISIKVDSQAKNFIKLNQTSFQIPKNIIKEKFLYDNAMKLENETIESLKAQCLETAEENRKLFKPLTKYFKTLNNAYVSLYFNLKFLNSDITEATNTDVNYPLKLQPIIENHFNEINDDLIEILEKLSAGYKDRITNYLLSINLMDNTEIINYILEEDLLAEEFLRDFKPCLIELRNEHKAIKNLL